ncbi:MAG: AAA family ATPase [Anaerolineae bacterium]|nr:AAA family ATPase [Anaerolineae bacterium]
MEQILATKFFIPPLRRKALPRQRLFSILDRGCEMACSLFLLSAPAGTGKTTLLTSWLRERRLQDEVVWLSLDAEDNDAARFWAYFFEAVRRKLPQIDIDASLVYRPSATEGGIRSLLSVFLNATVSLNPEKPLVVVLDDFHLVQSPEISADMAYLIEQAPEHFHLFLLSRTDPLFPLSRFRLEGLMVEIRDRDLRFTPQETWAFFDEVLHLSLTELQAARLQERTEGWVAGLQLAGMSLANRADVDTFINTFSGDNRYIADYLFEESLAGLDDEERQFLYQTAILNQFNASLCAHLTGLPLARTAEFLERLEHGNFFLIPLDDAHEWYRYHHLGADLLRVQAQVRFSEVEIRRLHSAASDWYADRKLADDAIRHAAAAGDIERLVQLVTDNIPAAIYHYEVKTAERWLSLIPADVVDSNMNLLLGHAYLYHLIGQAEKVPPYLPKVERLLREKPFASEAEQNRHEGHWNALRFFTLVHQEQLDQALPLGELAVAQLPLDNIARLWMMTSLANMYLWHGDVNQAESLARAAVDASLVQHLKIEAINAYIVLAHVVFVQGHLRDEFAYYEQALALDPKVAGDYSPYSCITLTRMASNYRWAHDLEKAYTYAQRGMQLAERWREGESLLECQIELAMVLCAMREFDRSLALLEAAKRSAKQHSPWYLGQVGHREMYVLAQQAMEENRSLAVPLAWAREKYRSVPRPIPAVQKPVMMSAALLLALSHEVDKAMDLVHTLEQEERNNGRLSMLYMLLPIKALVQYHTGHSDDAFLTLDEIIAPAVAEGSIQHFLDMHAPMLDLLQAYDKARPRNVYIPRLLAAFGAKQEGYHLSKDGLVEELTARELEILEMISLGYTNAEIAEKLFLAETTVKKHISNIFGKLGVKKRTQAVQRGRELKLLA